MIGWKSSVTASTPNRSRATIVGIKPLILNSESLLTGRVASSPNVQLAPATLYPLNNSVLHTSDITAVADYLLPSKDQVSHILLSMRTIFLFKDNTTFKLPVYLVLRATTVATSVFVTLVDPINTWHQLCCRVFNSNIESLAPSIWLVLELRSYVLLYAIGVDSALTGSQGRCGPGIHGTFRDKFKL